MAAGSLDFFFTPVWRRRRCPPPPLQVILASDWSALAEAAKDPTSCASSRFLYQRRDGEQMAGTGVPGCAERDLLKPAFKKLTCSNKSAQRHPGGGGGGFPPPPVTLRQTGQRRSHGTCSSAIQVLCEVTGSKSLF